MPADKTKILILGAGFGGVYVYKRLDDVFCKDAGVELAIVNPRDYFLFTPLLHEVVTGLQKPQNITEALRDIIGDKGTLHLGSAALIDAAKQTVQTTAGVLDYDYLVIALGAATNFFSVPGASDRALTLKSLEEAIAIKNHLIAQIKQAAQATKASEQERLLRFVIVGGGATGVELAAEMSEFLADALPGRGPQERALSNKTKITLLQADQELLLQFAPSLRKAALATLQRKGIEVRLQTAVTRVDKGAVMLASGEKIETNTVIWVAGVKPQTIDFTANDKIARTKNGQLIVNEYLQLTAYNNVFALGDVAAFTNPGDDKPLPALAQVASKQAKGVADNITRLVKNKKPQLFKYKHSGDLVSVGRWMAVGKIAGIAFSGRLAWLLWRAVYLAKLLSWRKKVKVAMEWILNCFSRRDISEL